MQTAPFFVVEWRNANKKLQIYLQGTFLIAIFLTHLKWYEIIWEPSSSHCPLNGLGSLGEDRGRILLLFHVEWRYLGYNINNGLSKTLQWRHNERKWRLKSPAPRVCVHPFVQAEIKENIKFLREWHLWGESTGDQCNTLTKGQWGE